MARHATLLDVRHLDERLALSAEFTQLRVEHRELLAERHHWRLYDLLEAGDLAAARAEQARLEASPPSPCASRSGTARRVGLARPVGRAGRRRRRRPSAAPRSASRTAGARTCGDALSTWAAKLLMLRRRQGRLGELADVVERLVPAPRCAASAGAAPRADPRRDRRRATARAGSTARSSPPTTTRCRCSG